LPVKSPMKNSSLNIVVVLSLFSIAVYGCSNATKPAGDVIVESATSGVLESSSNAVEFRDRFIASHELFSSCRGFPSLARSADGRYLLSKTGDLGTSTSDWQEVSIGVPTTYKAQNFLIEEVSGVPLLTISDYPVASDGTPNILSRSRKCAVFQDPSIAIGLIDQWFSDAQVNRAAAQTLISEQIAISQPVLADWNLEANASKDADPTFRITGMNVSAGLMARDGYFQTKSGQHQIWTACKDIFNPTAESSCSAPLEIRID